MKFEIEDLKQRNIYLFDEIDDHVSMNLIKEINDINFYDNFVSKNLNTIGGVYIPPSIDLNIKSIGGCCASAYAIIDAMERSVAPVHTHVSGEAASAAVLISMCGKYRTASKYANFMIHGASGYSEGLDTDIESALNNLKFYNAISKELFFKRTKISTKEYKEIIKSKTDFYFDAKRALKLGIIDNII